MTIPRLSRPQVVVVDDHPDTCSFIKVAEDLPGEGAYKSASDRRLRNQNHHTPIMTRAISR